VKYNGGVRTSVNKWVIDWLIAGAMLALVLGPWGQSVWARGVENEKDAVDHYSLEIDVDYRNGSYTGQEKINVINRGRDELDSVYFILYPNVGLPETELPWVSVQRVAEGSRELRFGLRSRNAVIKVELSQKLLEGQSIELTLDFSAKLPRIQREESSLLAHFLQEVNDAVSDERQAKDARDIFFASEEAMLLGYFYPILSIKPPQGIEQSSAIGVGAIVACDPASYDVKLTVDEGVTVIGSGDLVENRVGPRTKTQGKARRIQHFRGDHLRGFGLALVERVKSLSQQTRNVRLVSYFREADERLGKRALTIGSDAVESYAKIYGEYPHSHLNLIEMPLPAGFSSIEFPGMVIMAQAYYIDFDSPQSARLPGVLREQSDVIRSAFEFTLAHGVAKQWWGHTVGNDPERAAYLDEALATYSAAYYHESVYGKRLGDLVVDQQLRGAYQAYRMLGGVDIEADKPAREYRNALQYTAIVQAKAALLLVALRRELGDDAFFSALRKYYTTNRFQLSSGEKFRAVFFLANEDQRPVRALFQRWLKEKHADEDIGAPDLSLVPPPVSKIRALGRVFVKLGRTAAKPF
jgi:hypothetical protein